MSHIALLRISGKDQLGTTAEVTSLLAQHGASVLDVGQAVIHSQLSLGMLVQFPVDCDINSVKKAANTLAKQLNMQIEMQDIDIDEYHTWQSQGNQPSYVVTMLSRHLSAAQITGLTRVLANEGMNIRTINRLSDRLHLNAAVNDEQFPIRSVEFLVCCEKQIDEQSFKEKLLSLGQRLDMDLAVQKQNVYRRHRRFIAFDLDNTLIKAEAIVEMAKAVDQDVQVEEITEAAMRGEIDFAQSLRRRVALLESLPIADVKKIAEQLELSLGAEELVHTLKHLGYKIALISGGFTIVAETIAKKLGIDYVAANELEVKRGKLTGLVKEPILDAQGKAEKFLEFVNKEQLKVEQTIAVGDGANDIQMLAAAGMGIAFRAKPKVNAKAQHSLRTTTLFSIMFLLGLKDREIKEISQIDSENTSDTEQKD